MNTDIEDRMTTRRMRRDFRTKEWNRWLALDRELNELQGIKNDAPEVPLDKPYQRGWKRRFVLDECIMKRPDASDILIVLDAINPVQYCRKGLFLDGWWQKRSRPLEHKLWKTQTTNIHQTRIPSHLLCYFSLPSGISLRGYHHVWELKLAGYNLPLRFIYSDHCHSVVEPHYITHRKVAMPAVDARIQEIENFMERHQIWEKIQRRRWWDRHLERDRAIRLYHEREIEEELLTYETPGDPQDSGSFFMMCVIPLNSFKDGDVGHFVAQNKKI